MPTRAAGICPRQPCPYKRGSCPRHSRSLSDPRSSSQRGYGATWRRTRAEVLSAEPFCGGYPAGVHGGALVASTSVDHIKAKSQGGTDDRANLRGLCGSCNSRKAVKEEGARPR